MNYDDCTRIEDKKLNKWLKRPLISGDMFFPGSICLYRDVPWPGRIERSSLNMDLHHVSYCATMWAIVFNIFSNTEVISSIDR